MSQLGSAMAMPDVLPGYADLNWALELASSPSRLEGYDMRWFHLAVVVLFVVVMIIFAFQNFDAVTVRFLGFSINTRVAIVMIVVYVIGAVTGGGLLALLRRSYEGSQLHLGGSSPVEERDLA